MLSQSLQNLVDQLQTPLNPAGFRPTLAPNVGRPIIPSRQATALRSGLLEGIRWAGCVQAPRRWITRTAPHRWIMGQSARSDTIGCARLLAHHWLCGKNIVIGPKRKPSSGWASQLLGPKTSNCVVFFIVCSVFCECASFVFLHRLLCFLWTCWLCIFASFEINWHCVAKFSYFCSIQMKNDQIFKGQIYFYHAKWPQTIQKLSFFVHII